MPKHTIGHILRRQGAMTQHQIFERSPATLTPTTLSTALKQMVAAGIVLQTERYDSTVRREVSHYEIAPSQMDVDTGLITHDPALLAPDVLGEILRAHVYGAGRGYRDMTVCGPYAKVSQDVLEQKIVDELLGDPDCRDDWMKVIAYQGDNLLIAYATDGDTSLLFRIALPSGIRTLVNHDAKRDYGWTEI